MSNLNYDSKMKPVYKICKKNEILNEPTVNIVKTEIDFAKKWLDSHIEKKDFILTDCKQSIIDFIEMKKNAIQESAEKIKHELNNCSGRKHHVTVLKEDIENILKYIDNQ